MKRRTGYFGQQLGDSDFLQVQSNTQKYLGFMMADFLGSTAAIFTGLNVTPGAGFTLNISKGNLYQQINAEATAWGSAGHGLPTDATPVTKQGCIELPLTNQFSGSFAVPGSGTNFYTLEGKISDVDANTSSPPLTFTDTSGIESFQTFSTDRITQITLQIKGPNSGSPPAPDTGFITIATIAIPAGASSMLSGYITQAAQFGGFASILAGGGFVQISPGGAQTGFINITGSVTCASVSIGVGGITTLGTILASGLVTANGGLNVPNSATANLSGGATVAPLSNSTIPLVVNGNTGGAQTASLLQLNLQPGGTTVFSVDPAGNVVFGNGQAQLKLGSSSTKFIPAGSSHPFSIRNAADSVTNAQVLDAGGLTVLPTSATNPSCVLPSYSSSGGVSTGGMRKTRYSISIAAGSSSGTVTLSGDGIIAVPLVMTGNVTDPGSGGPYDTAHFVKSIAYNQSTHVLTVTIDSNASVNPCLVTGSLEG